jgi:DNA (cytosine-5)-methyltransferase 1
MARIIGEVLPRFVFVENSPLLVGRGLARVLGDLAEMGYDARWCVLGAHHAGAPHKRDRIWLIATDAKSSRAWADKRGLRGLSERCGEGEEGLGCEDGEMADSKELLGHECDDHSGVGLEERQVSQSGDGGGAKNVADAKKQRLEGRDLPRAGRLDGGSGEISQTVKGWWFIEPDLGRVAHGVAARVDRLKAIGNGQVPAVAALAWEILGGEMNFQNKNNEENTEK